MSADVFMVTYMQMFILVSILVFAPRRKVAFTLTLHVLDLDPPAPRAIRPAPEPLGNYIRPSFGDYSAIEQALAEERGMGTGLVINPLHPIQMAPLAREANRLGVETVLDSKSLELSTRAGFERNGIRALDWADDEPHVPSSFRGSRGADVMNRLAEVVMKSHSSAVLAMSHYVADPASPWWNVDAELVRMLRASLDDLGGHSVRIYYPLMSRTSSVLDDAVVEQIIGHLLPLPIDALWLRLHPFGTGASGPLALKRYLDVCRRLHGVGVPLVADRSGDVGVALMAFGAVGGMESGVTFGDSVNLDSVLKPPREGLQHFGRSARVYLHSLGAFLESDRAREFFSHRGMKSVHSCFDDTCCPRGWADMTTNPRGHFLRSRATTVAELAAVPPRMRPAFYMDGFLRPASDRASRAAEVEPSLALVRKRLDAWRRTLGADQDHLAGTEFSTSQPAAGRSMPRSA